MPIARRAPIEPDAPNSGVLLPESATHDDGDGRKYILLDDGSKFYLLPQDASSRDSGGSFHKPANWNPKTGKWEPGGVDWQSVGIWIAGATIGGYAALAYEPVAATTAATTAGATGTAAGAGTAATGTGGALAATTTVPTATGTIAGGTGIGAGAGTAAGTGGTVASTGGIVGKLGGWGNLIGIGAQFGAQYLQNRANSNALDKQISASERAAELEAASRKEALDFTKAAYEREQEQLAPYVGSGGAAVTKLSQLMGLGTPPAYKPLPVQAPIPAALGVKVGDPRLGTLAGLSEPSSTPPGIPQTNAGGGMVLMQAPDGSRRTVPQALVPQATAKGAQVIGNA